MSQVQKMTQFDVDCTKILHNVIPSIRTHMKGLGFVCVVSNTGTTVTVGFPDVNTEGCKEISATMLSLKENFLHELYQKNALILGKVYSNPRSEKCVWRIELVEGGG